MKLINCPDEYALKHREISCFMAGGMGNTDWHKAFIETLQKHSRESLDKLVVFNPYNAHIDSLEKQINWEYRYLNSFKHNRHIFSIYFDKYSNQPVSMFELGRMIGILEHGTVEIETDYNFIRLKTCPDFPLVISINKESPVKDDVLMQCQVAKVEAKIRTPEQHANEVILKYNILEQRRLHNGQI